MEPLRVRPLLLNDMKPRCFLLVLLAIALCQGYTLRGPVSWVISPGDVVEDADMSEEEEVAPALLADSAGLWKQAYPSTEVLGDGSETPADLVKRKDENMAQFSSRLFSYKMEKGKKKPTSSGGSRNSPPPHQETARTARYIAHYSDWGFLSTISTQDEVRHGPFHSNRAIKQPRERALVLIRLNNIQSLAHGPITARKRVLCGHTFLDNFLKVW